ncbi:hypothetical protein [Streptomyces sp. HUAS TT3]|uniref:hypothetical protein n=1 Tax=Streptomyces sp. HUAS TT3 TaxID=3447510 RepID=UPI003F65735E
MRPTFVLGRIAGVGPLVGLVLGALPPGDAGGGLWLAVIGWFLAATATVQGQQAHLRGVLAGVPVRPGRACDG